MSFKLISTILGLSFVLVLLSCGASVTSTDDGDSSVSSSSETDASSSSVTKRSSSSSISSSTISSSSFVSSSSVEVVSGTFTDIRDGHTYTSIVIGTQTWMAQNLAWLPSVNAESDYSSTVAKYYVYDYDGTSVSAAKATSNYTTYGALYNYDAALTACPTGWHLPTDAEWTTLESYVGSSAGTQLKANSSLWSTNTGTNTSGFTALPGGYYYGGSFGGVGNDADFWTATADGTSYAWERYLYYITANVYRSSNYQGNGFSVRCLKDSN
jgi:uncharacterized protein (TIGR02145 family)